MKSEIESTFCRNSGAALRPAPSLRVPVTAHNREYLRWLRAAELSAWEQGKTAVTTGQARTFPRPACAG
jgi:hypothetical protein